VFEVAEPQRARLVASPTATDLLQRNTQLAPCGSFASQVVIEGAPGNGATELPLEDPIDNLVRTLGLLLLQLYGASQ
jgi:hypothetical protein